MDKTPDRAVSPEETLWLDYWDCRSPNARNAIFLRHMPLVNRIAKHIHKRVGREVQLDDLVQVGSMGLLKAIEAYDPSHGVPFPLYASRRIRGAVLDEFRSADWVPRKVRQQVRAVTRAADALEAQLGRDPSPEEVLETVKLPPELGDRWAAASRVVSHLNLSSLNIDFGHGGRRTVSVEDRWQDHRCVDPCEAAMRNELVDVLRTNLSERQMKFVHLHYFESRSFREIAQHLGVSERWAFKLRAQVIGQFGRLADGNGWREAGHDRASGRGVVRDN